MTDDGWRLPAEHEPHERTLISWPTDEGVYGPLVGAAREAHAEVAKVIAEHEPVTMLTPMDQVELARSMCPPTVEIQPLALDDSWVRDTGPVYQVSADGSRRRALLWQFNGYGHKAPHDLDATLAARWCEISGESSMAVEMVLEGGSILSDGRDLLLTTSQCLLHPSRNPHLRRIEIERILIEATGMRRVVWLPFGLVGDLDTDGHVDNLAAFGPAGQLLLQTCAETDREDHHRLRTNRRWIEGTADADGIPLRIVEIPVLPEVHFARRALTVPYLNFYVANGLVLVPTTGHRADGEMLDLIAAEYPDRRVIGLEVGAILAFGGGGIHCITQQVPATR